MLMIPLPWLLLVPLLLSVPAPRLAGPMLAPRPRSTIRVQPTTETGAPAETVPRFTLPFLQQLATVQQQVRQVLAADSALAITWEIRATLPLRAQLIATTPVLQQVYTAAGLTPPLVAASLQQLREIYLRARQLRSQHPDVDVTTLVDPTMGDARWVENFRFIEAHRQQVNALSLRVMTLPQPSPVMDVTDSTDPSPGLPLASHAGPPAPPLRVLFIGNSLTYVNDIPARFREIAASGLQRRIVTRMLAIPGVSLPDLWQGGYGAANHVLLSQPWDVVVLQGRLDKIEPQPDVDPKDINSVIGVIDTAHFFAVVRAFGTEIAAQHARGVLYIPSQGGDEDPLTRAVFDSVHSRIGRALGLLVAHAGDVVARFNETHPQVHDALYEPGGEHQSILGAYLQALVLYTTLTQQLPVGLPHPVLPGLTDSLATLFQAAAVSDFPGLLGRVGRVPATTPLSRPFPPRSGAGRHLWVTAYWLGGQGGVYFQGDATAAPTDSLDVWAVVTEDSVTAGPGSTAPTAVLRARHLLQTVSARDGMEPQNFQLPPLPPGVVPAHLQLTIVVQRHGAQGHDRIVGTAPVPLPFATP